jgi:uncharacterized membrane protein YedE/YeeE
VAHQQLAWYLAGPALGLCVVAIRAVFGARLGVTGGFSAIVEKVSARSLRFDWRGWFALGIVAGGLLFSLAWGSPVFEGYGWLTDTFTGSARVWIAPILALAGVAIGYGAKLAGGCTSGNGLSGISSLSVASVAATATFFGTAIVVSVLIKAVI